METIKIIFWSEVKASSFLTSRRTAAGEREQESALVMAELKIIFPDWKIDRNLQTVFLSLKKSLTFFRLENIV